MAILILLCFRIGLNFFVKEEKVSERKKPPFSAEAGIIRWL